MDTNEHLNVKVIECSTVTEDGIQDISILSKGEAAGHGVVVDEKTIDQLMRLSIGKSVPAYLTHEGAVDASGRPKDRLGREIGMFSGFYRDGDKIRARNFQFLESFKTQEPKTYQTILELAKNFSDKLGISPVLRNFKAWVTNDGREIPDDGKTVPADASGPLPAMRVKDLLSFDFVQKPAANLGLFSADVDAGKTNKDTTMDKDTILLSKHTEEVTALQTQHKDAITALETKHKETVTALEAKVNEFTAQLAKATEDSKGLTAALAAKTKEAEDSAKYDMRKAGAPALEVALMEHGGKIPVPAEKPMERWAQYDAMCEDVKGPNGIVIGRKPTAQALKFFEKYLKS